MAPGPYSTKQGALTLFDGGRRDSAVSRYRKAMQLPLYHRSLEAKGETMETWDAMTSRRNVREFEDTAVRSDDLDRVLEAGRRSPSARNWQPWDFVVVTDRQQLADLARVWRGAWHVSKAPAAIAVIAPRLESLAEQATLQFDLGQATISMMLAAADLGLGTAHASVADQNLARQILGFPEDRFCSNLISIGTPADGPLTPIKAMNRRSFNEVVHRGRW